MRELCAAKPLVVVGNVGYRENVLDVSGGAPVVIGSGNVILRRWGRVLCRAVVLHLMTNRRRTCNLS